MGRAVVAALALALGLSSLAPRAPAQDRAATRAPRTAVVLHVDGAIGPASADHLTRGLARAAAQHAALVVLAIDTPGGLDTSMREIVRAVLAAPMPVIGWVGPSGARAASAGTFILYATHVATMAPGTNLGAATPVSIGGFPGRGDDDRSPGGDARPDSASKDDAKPGATARGAGDASRDGDAATTRERRAPRAPRSTMETKVTNDAVAYIRSLAELRGRNADWAEAAVREGASLSASAALERKVIDALAPDVAGAIAAAHGRTVQMADGPRTLDTRDLAIETVHADWRTKLLAALGSPNVALILMMIGVYGLLFEFMSPGAVLPGTLGAISLIVGLFALAALPFTLAGLALLVLGVVLIVAEHFSPSFGALGIGGTIALALGATILVDTDVPGLAVSRSLVAGIVVSGLLVTLLVARLAMRSRRHRAVTGIEGMIGAPAQVLDWAGDRGHVLAHGERWQARSERPLVAGASVRVTAVDGLVLQVVSASPDAH